MPAKARPIPSAVEVNTTAGQFALGAYLVTFHANHRVDGEMPWRVRLSAGTDGVPETVAEFQTFREAVREAKRLDQRMRDAVADLYVTAKEALALLSAGREDYGKYGLRREECIHALRRALEKAEVGEQP
jgi:hypothetical protein